MTTTARARAAVVDALGLPEAFNGRKVADFDRVRRHNTALRQWEHGDNLTPTDDEYAILDLLAGIYNWSGLADRLEPGETARGLSPWEREYITEPLVTAARNALNLELGRLMGVALSSFLEDLAKSADVTIDRTGDGWAMWLDVDAGRVFLKFDERCSPEVYAQVRRHGFVWARSVGSFVRKDTPNARLAASRFADTIDTITQGETP
jgi:hypothetical protein